MHNYQTYYYYVLVLSWFSSTFKYFHSITLFVLRQYCLLHNIIYAPVNRVLYQHNGTDNIIDNGIQRAEKKSYRYRYQFITRDARAQSLIAFRAVILQ